MSNDAIPFNDLHHTIPRQSRREGDHEFAIAPDNEQLVRRVAADAGFRYTSGFQRTLSTCLSQFLYESLDRTPLSLTQPQLSRAAAIT